MIGAIAVLLFANTLLLFVSIASNNEYVRNTNRLIMRIWSDTGEIKDNTKFLWTIDNVVKLETERLEDENKSYKQRLKEVFPHAIYGNDDLPEVCAGQLFGFNCTDKTCAECWHKTETERRVQNANS